MFFLCSFFFFFSQSILGNQLLVVVYGTVLASRHCVARLVVTRLCGGTGPSEIDGHLLAACCHPCCLQSARLGPLTHSLICQPRAKGLSTSEVHLLSRQKGQTL